ncbi:family D DNA polymerase large subunit [Candidatus Mancarchaeum acidiphilum]|uniref:DNA polymerase II large subunit n=1 Tax=Candidatus Mancarchaeum acidiphilum TaxID=1920749 RepID=A0A218NNM2_9ARCH|nr:DNA polymerase II large subunit [Candidatus Mancarchaeum acidiphilum]ASI14065.1 family D DNA polymerase large subunit [Candidatus Mancarchaeum acidiphilum]
MYIDDYFRSINEGVKKAYELAERARSKGYDPETFVEIKPAPDLASRVEGIIGIDGLAKIIEKEAEGVKSNEELAFNVARYICKDTRFDDRSIEKRLLLAARVGLAILTDGILVAPTEGLQNVELHKNLDGTTYAAILYAGPIRGAGGTSAALSVALLDAARREFGIGDYKPTQTEIERFIEEVGIYNSRVARLQYLPPDEDIRTILQNCPVCIDGLPTEDIEVTMHRNIERLDANGNPQLMTNRVRSGICLVSCEGIAQKAKSVLKHTKNSGLPWDWLTKIIKVDKGTTTTSSAAPKTAVFLQELVAGRPVFSYPDHPGAFRLRYGRSRFTGIASKGFNPVTMSMMNGFIATGTQLKVEKPGKGCVAVPVTSIEGPFVKLDTGEAFRIDKYQEYLKYKDRIQKIMSVGDILVTYGDFKKTNTPMQPTSYVEEYWYLQLTANGYSGGIPEVNSFKDAYEFSKKYNVPIHPKYLYDYSDINISDMKFLINKLKGLKFESDNLFDVKSIEFSGTDLERARNILEVICIPHFDKSDKIIIEQDDAQSLILSAGLVDDEKVNLNKYDLSSYNDKVDSLSLLNSVSPIKIMRRSTRIGGRMGRPEKAKERMMKPSPNVLFPISDYGTRERSIYKALMQEYKNLGNKYINVEMANFICDKGGEPVTSFYCTKHKCRAHIEKICKNCGNKVEGDKCEKCGGSPISYSSRSISLVGLMEEAMKNVDVNIAPKNLKGVMGLVSGSKVPESLDKGILRAIHNITIFKDGTSRFDATDTPLTHFYPREMNVSVEALKKLGYDKDYLGNPLEKDDQLVEMMHQDVIMNNRGAEYLLHIAQFIDDLLVRFYRLEPYYNIKTAEDLLGHYVITLSPHTSAGVVGRIVGFTKANVGFAHPYYISARRRNCDGDEDTTMLMMDALLNFSKSYLPTTIGGTMDAPLILTVNVKPEEVDDEVHNMEITKSYSKEFYDKTFDYVSPSDEKVLIVEDNLDTDKVYSHVEFTHLSDINSIDEAPLKSAYTTLKTMQDKIDMQFELMDKLYTIDKKDTARRLIMSHFIPDLMGNLHSFSKQTFRCVTCNAKYRRVPLSGKCTKCGGKLVLTISKGGIEKYLNVTLSLIARYSLEDYINQRVLLIKDEIETVFGGIGEESLPTNQFNLSKFL